MSFSVRIAADLVSVEAGATVPLGIEIANRSDEQDRFEMEVEGLDPDWTAVPVPTFTAEARDIQTEKVFFKPPRVSESLAGTFPFVIKVRSLITGEQRSAQGIFEIKPYHHLTMEVAPKKGVYAATRKSNTFQVTIMNLGNTEHTLQLFASDPEDALAYDFDGNQIGIGPGQTRTVQLTAKPTESRPFSSSRLHGFSVSARSVETPSVACSAQAQLEERAVMSPGWIAIAVLGLLLFAGWLALIPKPPRMDSLTISPSSFLVGEKVTVKWSSSNAASVKLQIDAEPAMEVRSNDQYEFTARSEGTIVATAVREQKESVPKTLFYKAGVPPETPTPVVEQFDITPRQARLGSPLLVKYKLKDVTEATLEPSGTKLDPTLESTQITADLTGPINYRIVAKNGIKTARSKAISVNIFEGSDATILAFKLDTEKLPSEGGTVVLTWQVSNTARLDLKVGTEEMPLEIPSGTRSFNLSASTEFTLTATDEKGRKTVQKKRVEVQPPAEPPSTTGVSVSTAGGGVH